MPKWTLRKTIRLIDMQLKRCDVWNARQFRNHSKIVKSAKLNLRATFAPFVIFLMTNLKKSKSFIVKAVEFVELEVVRIISTAIIVHAAYPLDREITTPALKTSLSKIVQYVWTKCKTL